MLRRFTVPLHGKLSSTLPTCLTLHVRHCLTIVVPTIAESISTGKIQTWTKQVGDVVDEDDVVCCIESDKTTVDVRAPKSGTLTNLMAEEGKVVNVGEPIATLKEGEGKAQTAPSDAESPEKSKPAAAAAAAPPPPSQPKASPPASKPAPAAPAAASPSQENRVHAVRISAMRQQIAERLKNSQNTAAMLTTFNEVDMTPLMAIRDKHKDEFLKKHGVKLGFMSPFAKACAAALQEIPVINASWADDVIEYHNFVDISIAVATPTGLVVPVLRDVQSMTLSDIEKKIEDFGSRARVNRISIPEMSGGTFTISNGGTFGSWLGTPIINPPQSAILGMHAIKKKPWVVNDEIKIRHIMAVALTYDHRLIDGRDAVSFLVKVKNLIEDPTRLLLDLA